MFTVEFAQGESPKQPSGKGYRSDCPLCGNPIVDQHPRTDRFIVVEGKRVVVHAEGCIDAEHPAHGIFAFVGLPKAA